MVGLDYLLMEVKNQEEKIKDMFFWDVNNGVARRAWARNKGSIEAIQNEMKKEPRLKLQYQILYPKILLKILKK